MSITEMIALFPVVAMISFLITMMTIMFRKGR